MRFSSSLGFVFLLTAAVSAQEGGGDSEEEVTEVVTEGETEEVAEVDVEEVVSEEAAQDETEVGADEAEAEATTSGAEVVAEESTTEVVDGGLPNAAEDASDAELHDFVANGTALTSPSDIEAMFARLREYVKPEADAGLKLAAVRSLSSANDERSLPMILEFISSMDPIVLSSTSVRETFVRAIVEQLEQRGGLTSFASVAREAQPETQSIIAMAVARSGSPDSVGFLVDLLGANDQLDRTILRQIELSTKAGGAADARPHDESLRTLRSYLESGSSDLCRGAIVALGSLHDIDSIPSLAQRLSDEDTFVSHSTHSALSMMARVDLGQDPALWQAWYEEQMTWWRETAPGVILNLKGEDPGEAHKSLAALLQHPLWRHELAEAIGPLVQRTDLPIASEVCTALGRLGSRRAIPYLLDAVLSDQPDVHAKANAALRILTGLELNADYLEWSQALGV